jgi:hypothetical protein
MTNETLKLVQLKWDNGLIIPMYTINIFMDPSIYINNKFLLFQKKLHNNSFVKIMIIRP